MNVKWLFFVSLFISLLLIETSVYSQGQALVDIERTSNTFIVIPDSIRNHIKSFQNGSESIKRIIRLVESLQHRNPHLALFIIGETYSDNPIRLETDWIKLQYLKTWLQKEIYTENEELEILLNDALTCADFFEEKKNTIWQVKALSLLSDIHYHLSYNQGDHLLKEALNNNQQALKLIKDSNIASTEIYSILGEIYRIRGNIFLQNKKYPLDTAMVAYDMGLEFLRMANNQQGQADILLNKAIAYTKSEVDSIASQAQEDPAIFYKKAIEISLKSTDPSDIAKVYLEFATYLAEKFTSSKEKKWFNKSNNQLYKSLGIQSVKKSEAYLQLGVNFQNILSYGISDSDQEEAYLDSLTYFYSLALKNAKSENNLFFFNEIYNRLAIICPYIPKHKCTEILKIVGTTHAYFIKKNKEINTRITEKNILIKSAIEEQKRHNLLLTGFIISSTLVALFFIFYQRLRIKNLNQTLSIKLEALRAQMNPHFISNSINAIESLVNQNRNEEASEYLIDFSRLSRLVLNHSKHPLITLKEEINSLKYFLSLERLRLGEDLEYVISIDNILNPNIIIVPPMILQPFVENAIWHGIKNKEEPKQGFLKIEINRKNKSTIEYIIEDNGVGRIKAKDIRQQSIINQESWGTTITRQRIEMITKIKDSSLEIIDLYDTNNNPKGTRVIVLLPIKLKK